MPGYQRRRSANSNVIHGIQPLKCGCQGGPGGLKLEAMAAKPAPSLPIPKAAIGFRSEHLDFQRGIRVGNLKDHERITRILKLELEHRYQEPFVTERYGRGVYWQWIGYLPRSNRAAKSVSSHVSFGCSKLFVMVDTEEKMFKCGLQVERGRADGARGGSDFTLQSDWDWHRLTKALKPHGPMERELNRLTRREGFRIRTGTWTAPVTLARSGWRGAPRLKRILQDIDMEDWAFFQLYYPMREDEVRSSTGVDLIEAMLAVFQEVTPAMNLCMQTCLKVAGGEGV
jgi:hypothetical protein